MADTDDLDLNVEEAPKPKRGKLWLIIALVIVLGAGVAGGLVFVASGEGEEAAEAAPEPLKAPVYKEIDPPLVVNFQGPSRIRYVQVGMVISSTDKRTLDAVDRHMPVIRNNLIMLLSDKTYEELNSREGKERTRQEVLDNVRQVLFERTGEANIDAVYFTSFVMQ
ncbi:flagellar basal body protein FliL [Thioalkalivibrio denitrificans]|uniref:Flagellar protein FliL n=1 Tax=Thioalkalivibrio denitrificans TaxID=108003 RepID=A0A1V3NN68_9GAMM|nr:flagellar basal body-associated FliL family protein [Thioalkalivibrio denitrificans]OOG26196.1 flagellar basal body protein FliL [Thioalkalivibrio denitrificans]